MTDFASLDPDTRSLALVGSYLQHWAVMESALNNVLRKALGLDRLNGVIVAKNVSLRDKIKIVRTAIDMAYITPDSTRESYKKIVQSIADLSYRRNMIAHDFFNTNHRGEGVSFFVVKASSSLEFPDTTWTTEKFLSEFEILDDVTEQLDAIEKRLDSAAMAKALYAYQSKPPNETPYGLGLLSSLFHPLQEPQNSLLAAASPETDRQTPPAPPASEGN